MVTFVLLLAADRDLIITENSEHLLKLFAQIALNQRCSSRGCVEARSFSLDGDAIACCRRASTKRRCQARRDGRMDVDFGDAQVPRVGR
jgi:hypothetical protein